MGNPNLDDWSHATEGRASIAERDRILAAIELELARAYKLHGCPRWGRHEAFAIILEEMEEVKRAVFDDEPIAALRKELIQVAAMCVRYLETEPRFRDVEQPTRPTNKEMYGCLREDCAWHG